jgi:pimeloyl-ACP methyl ester carboxylesterase
MPRLAVGDTELHVEDSGPGSTGETILLSHGLLWSTRLFDPQVAALAGRYRCVAYDHRGQGSSAEHDGPSVPIETCYDDAVALIEALGLAPVHVCGVAMGGFVGLRLAARRPDLVRSLTLLATSAESEPPERRRRYAALAAVARVTGIRPVAGRVMPLMFGRTFRSDPARALEREVWRDRLINNRRSIHKAVRGVLEGDGVVSELPAISAPTLVAVGEEDAVTPPARSDRLAARLSGARLERIPAAGHSLTVEQPRTVNAAMEGFLAGDAAPR